MEKEFLIYVLFLFCFFPEKYLNSFSYFNLFSCCCDKNPPIKGTKGTKGLSQSHFQVIVPPLLGSPDSSQSHYNQDQGAIKITHVCQCSARLLLQKALTREQCHPWCGISHLNLHNQENPPQTHSLANLIWTVLFEIAFPDDSRLCQINNEKEHPPQLHGSLTQRWTVNFKDLKNVSVVVHMITVRPA